MIASSLTICKQKPSAVQTALQTLREYHIIISVEQDAIDHEKDSSRPRTLPSYL